MPQLYREASFLNLKQLQLAIEEEKLHLRHARSNDNAKTKLWWRRTPNWWDVTEGRTTAAAVEEKEAADKRAPDWWHDSEYKGLRYAPLSADPIKVTTQQGEKDVKAMLSSTWGYEGMDFK